MSSPTSRWLALGVLTGAGALTSVMTAGLAFGQGNGSDVALITAGADVLGGGTSSGPDPAYVTDVYNLFVNPPDGKIFPAQDIFPGFEKTGLDLPALDTPFVSDQGFAQAVNELNTAITQTYAGDHIVVTSYSESATVATLEMQALDKMTTGAPDKADLSFILLGDLNNPNGGIYERFSPLNPGIDYFSATPPDTPYPTDIYTIQYDGVADFPQYPSDIPADLNALAGYGDTHLLYPSLSAAQLGTAVVEPTSAGYLADGGDTTYYMIPTQNLPLLDVVRDIPGFGKPLADFIQPDLRVLVDMGYNYNNFAANVPTPADFNYPDYNYANVMADMELGLQQGITAAQVDMGMLPSTDLPDIYPYVPYVPGGTIPNPDLILPNSADSVDPLQSLFSGFDTSLFTGDLSALSTDLSTALSHLAPDFAAIGLDPGLFTSFLGLF